MRPILMVSCGVGLAGNLELVFGAYLVIILSHRGYWKDPSEKNAMSAFDRSFALGFGTETDIRDDLVISHDPPNGSELSLAELLKSRDQYARDGRKLPMALNVKADGLYGLLSVELARAGLAPDDYFVFDMSVPDALGYLKAGITAFTRQSEYEQAPAFYDRAAGVWIDCFHSDWIDLDTIQQHLDAGKKVCLVSPDLHRRPYEQEWSRLRAMPVTQSSRVMICTDYPEEARLFFGNLGRAIEKGAL